MKVGAENRTKVILAISLGVILLIVIATQKGGWFGGASSSAAAPPVARVTNPVADSLPARRTGGRSRPAPKKDTTAARSMDPSLRLDLLKASEDTKYEGAGRNIFRVFVEPPHIVKSPVLDQHPVDKGPPPPAPPPIFLAKGEDVFIAKEGDIVDRRYKVVRISQNAVEILDVLSNNRQSIPITQG